MSAWIISKSHVDAIVAVVLDGPTGGEARWEGPRWAEGDPRVIPWQEQVWRECSVIGSTNRSISACSPDQLGRLLVDECVASVSYRYPNDDVQAGELPGPCDAYYLEPYTFERHRKRLTIVEAFSAISCFEYQSCEHPGWIDSEAKRALDGLKETLIGQLPGYSAAPWGIDIEHVS